MHLLVLLPLWKAVQVVQRLLSGGGELCVVEILVPASIACLIGGGSGAEVSALQSAPSCAPHVPYMHSNLITYSQRTHHTVLSRRQRIQANSSRRGKIAFHTNALPNRETNTSGHCCVTV